MVAFFFEENSVTKKIKNMKEVLRYEEGLGGNRKIGTGRKVEKLPPSTKERSVQKKNCIKQISK